MRNGWMLAVAVTGAVASIVSSAANAASILVVGQNRNAIYQVDYTGDPTLPASYSSTVSLYASLSGVVTSANEQLYGIARDNVSGDVFVTTANNGTGAQARIIKVDAATKTPTVLATRGVSTPNWSTANPNGIQVGPDGRVYFATAFGTGNTQGVFALNQDGTGFTQFIAPSTSTPGLTLATRDLVFTGGKVYLTQRTAVATTPALFRYTDAGVFEAVITETRLGAQSIGLAPDGTLYVGHNFGGSGAIEIYDPVAGTFSNAVTSGTAPANSLGLNTINGQMFYLDFNAGTTATGQLRRANANADVVFSFVGKNDPLSTTGGTLTGYQMSEFVALPEPATLGVIGSALTMLSRRRRSR